MKLEALDHPKTLDLAARLKCSIPQAIGHLELLWAWVGKKAVQGNVGKWPDGAIARACFWDGDPEVFVTALADARFIDRHPTHRYIIHDWADHAPRWVKSKLRTEGLSFISGDISPDTSSDIPTDVSPDTKGREVKGSEVNGADAPMKTLSFWDIGESFGITRPTIGRMIRDNGESAVSDAIRNLSLLNKRPADPTAYCWGILKKSKNSILDGAI